MIHDQPIPPPARMFFALKKVKKKDSKKDREPISKAILKVSLQRNGYRKMA